MSIFTAKKYNDIFLSALLFLLTTAEIPWDQEEQWKGPLQGTDIYALFSAA